MRVSNRTISSLEPQRRKFLRAGLAAFGSLSLPGLFRLRAEAPSVGRERTAVIVVWLRGGGSHLDTYDPKPDAVWSTNWNGHWEKAAPEDLL